MGNYGSVTGIYTFRLANLKKKLNTFKIDDQIVAVWMFDFLVKQTSFEQILHMPGCN